MRAIRFFEGGSVAYAENRGQKIYFETEGEGHAVLFIAGFAADGRIWWRQRRALCADFRAVVMDNRGMGKSAATRADCTIADMAEDAAAVLRAAGEAKAHVVGVSMGGLVAAALAVARPEAVSRLALISSAIEVSAETLAGLSLACMALGRGGGAAFARLMIAQTFTAKFVRENARDIEAIEKSYTPSGEKIPEILRQFRAVTAFAGGEFRPPECESLVIGGREDMLVGAEETARTAALLPHASLEMLEGAGHGLLVERAEEVSGLLKSFFRGGTK
jgi:pimeloyl-ACP methyl ester carboxylesterase